MFSSSAIFVVFSFIGVALAQIAGPPPPPGPYVGPRPVYPGPVGPFVPIIQQNYDLNPDGSYIFGYQSADGSSRKEEATVRFPGPPAGPGLPPQGGDLAVAGSYAYVSPEGANIEVQYFADENGYQPSGPGIHPAILKAVAYQVAKARAENGGAPIGGPNPYPGAYPYPTPLAQPLVRPVRSTTK